MSSLAPVPPPESAGGGDEPPPSLSPPAPSPDSDDISPMPVPVFLIPPPLLSPPSSEPIALPSLPPLVVVSPTPLPTPPPTLSPPPPPILSPPLPPPQPQPPLTSPPPPITQTTPPQNNPTPPNIPPLPTITTKPPPPEQPTQPLPRPGFRKPKNQPSPFKQSPSRPKLKTPTSSPPPTSTSPLPTSAVLPSPPPVALPVPQAPGGGAWFPLDPPSPLPIFPGPPGPPLLGGPTNGNIGIPSAFAPSDNSGSADHQNIEAASASSSSSSSSSSYGRSNGLNGNIVVGFCVAGVLLLLLGAVFVILVIFCRRREKKFADYGSGSKHGTSFSGFEDKTSLSHYTKQDSNVANSQTPTTTSGPPTLNVGPTSGVGAPLCSGTFTYEELVVATDGFSDRNLLGQGGFGYVHKGVLPSGKEIAVKQLKMGGDQGEREFRAEVDTISQVHHKHLVSLVGYCIAGAERLLVYEFVSNNNLEFHLHGKGQPVMDWPTRLKIAIGSARGLAYLHEDCNPTIIHRDIKASNILLDYNFEAKVSDFGMAKIFTTTGSSITHMTTRVVGTFGYLAPEYASSGKVTDKSDVYSYGVMLLELITGRPPISNFGTSTNGSLVNWARPLLTQAIGDGNFEFLADPRLRKNYNVDEMASMVACAAACVRLSAWRRPRMSQVVHALEGNLPLSELDDGTRPGHSAMQFPYESLDFDAHNYMENLKRMAMTSNISGYTTSRYSENTSEYGLHPSASSTDTN